MKMIGDYTRERTALVGGTEPDEVGVEEEEGDQGDGHEVHVEAEEDAAVVEAPAALDAAESVGGADEGSEQRKDDPEGGLDVWGVGEECGEGDADEDKGVAACERLDARVEGGDVHAAQDLWPGMWQGGVARQQRDVGLREIV